MFFADNAWIIPAAVIGLPLKKRHFRRLGLNPLFACLEVQMQTVFAVVIIACGCWAAWGMWKDRNNDIVL
jgi:hypothetical protein